MFNGSIKQTIVLQLSVSARSSDTKATSGAPNLVVGIRHAHVLGKIWGTYSGHSIFYPRSYIQKKSMIEFGASLKVSTLKQALR